MNVLTAILKYFLFIKLQNICPYWANGWKRDWVLGSVLEFTNDQTCPEMKAHILWGKELPVTLGMSAEAGKILFRHAVEGT